MGMGESDVLPGSACICDLLYKELVSRMWVWPILPVAVVLPHECAHSRRVFGVTCVILEQ